jgi:hypothetical protein
MDARIRLKIGNLEVEYEGSDTFIKSDLLTLVSEAIDLLREQGDEIPTVKGAPSQPDIGKQLSGTTGTIASKLGVKSGPALIVGARTGILLKAAAAR